MRRRLITAFLAAALCFGTVACDDPDDVDTDVDVTTDTLTDTTVTDTTIGTTTTTAGG